jgi:hypothetical protein
MQGASQKPKGKGQKSKHPEAGGCQQTGGLGIEAAERNIVANTTVLCA